MKLVAAVAVCALALTACAGEEETAAPANAPSPAEMLERAVTAMQDQKSAAFDLDLSVEGKSDDPQLKPFLDKPLKAQLGGKAGEGAVDLTGKVEAAGSSYDVGVRADRTQSFIQFMGTWYGPSDGLDSTSESNPADLDQLRKYGNDVLKGTVAEGDDDTWEFTGTLNPDGIVKVAAAEGEPMSDDDQTALRALAPLVKLRFSVNQDDGLFRELAVELKLTAKQMQLLKALGSEDVDLQELDVKLSVKLADYGTPVTIEAPADPQPIKALGGALLGALFAGAAA